MGVEHLSAHISGLEEHQELIESTGTLRYVVGNEGFLDTTKSVGGRIIDFTGAAASAAIKSLDEGFHVTTRKIATRFGSNKQGISVILRDIPRNGIKSEFNLSGLMLGSLTSDGYPSSILKDVEVLSNTLGEIEKYVKEVSSDLEAKLNLVKRITAIKTNEDAIKIIQEFGSLAVPTINLGSVDDTMTSSPTLPGNKQIEFELTKTPNYSMSGTKVTAASKELGFNEQELKSWLSSADKINSHHQTVSKHLTDYVQFIKRWGEAVKSSSRSIDSKEYLSESVGRQLERIMDGNGLYLVFYVGFLPKLIGYTDKYIQDVLGTASKLLN